MEHVDDRAGRGNAAEGTFGFGGSLGVTATVESNKTTIEGNAEMNIGPMVSFNKFGLPGGIAKSCDFAQGTDKIVGRLGPISVETANKQNLQGTPKVEIPYGTQDLKNAVGELLRNIFGDHPFGLTPAEYRTALAAAEISNNMQQEDKALGEQAHDNAIRNTRDLEEADWSAQMRANGPAVLLPLPSVMLGRAGNRRSTAMSNKSIAGVATVGIDIGKNSFHVVGLDRRGTIVLRQKWSRGQIEARLANMPRCLIG